MSSSQQGQATKLFFKFIKGAFIIYLEGGYDDFRFFPFQFLEAPPQCLVYFFLTPPPSLSTQNNRKNIIAPPPAPPQQLSPQTL